MSANVINEISIQLKRLGLMVENIWEIQDALVKISKTCQEEQKNIDEAYQKGFNDGKEYGLDEADMREAVSYQKGLSDAWEVARKIVFDSNEGGIRLLDFPTIFGNSTIQQVFRKNSAAEAIVKLKTYEEQKNKDVDKDVCRGCVWEGRYDGDCAMCSNNYRELYTPKKIDKGE